MVGAVGNGLTVINCEKLEVHPLTFSPVTVYEDVVEGLAFTIEPLVEFNPRDGDHWYVVAPEAVRVTLWPLQTVGTTGKVEMERTGGMTMVKVLLAQVEFVPMLFFGSTLQE